MNVDPRVMVWCAEAERNGWDNPTRSVHCTGTKWSPGTCNGPHRLLHVGPELPNSERKAEQ